MVVIEYNRINIIRNLGYEHHKRKNCRWGFFMAHSEKLEETVLWRVCQGKVSPNEKRSSWVKQVYEAAATYMMEVQQTFQNYTLHDETHIQKQNRFYDKSYSLINLSFLYLVIIVT